MDRIQISTVIDRTLDGSDGCSTRVSARASFRRRAKAGSDQVIPAAGPQPAGRLSILHVQCRAFGKPGAEVTICFTRNKTAQEEADCQGPQYEIDVNNARHIVENAKNAGRRCANLLKQINDSSWLDDPSTLFASDPKIWYSTAKSTVKSCPRSGDGWHQISRFTRSAHSSLWACLNPTCGGIRGIWRS